MIDLSSLTLETLRTAAATVSSSFAPKELELLQFGSEPYLIAYRPPTPDTVGQWSTRSGMDFITPTPDGDHVLVSPLHPDRAFARFDDETMMRVARKAMPGIAMRDAVWLSEYDDYYYKTVSSFDLGLPRMARTLPVLRVRYEDAADTWLYLTPAPGQSYKAERLDRANRWGYYGLHGLDFAFLYRHRPLWDLVAVALLVGVGVSSVTSIMPAFRRLARHARGSFAKQRHDILPAFLGGNGRRRVAELVRDVDVRGRPRAQQKTDRLETRTAPDRHV